MYIEARSCQKTTSYNGFYRTDYPNCSVVVGIVGVICGHPVSAAPLTNCSRKNNLEKIELTARPIK